jgi:hypothetical protein
MKGINQEPFGASEITVAPHVDDDRRGFRAKPSIESVWGNRKLTVVHAQSPRGIEYCAELGRGPSIGEPAFPRRSFLIAV